MTFQELQQQLTAAIAQLHAEGEVMVDAPFWLDSSSNGRTKKTYYRQRWFDAAGSKQSVPLSLPEYESIKAAIARGQKLQALEQEKQQVAAAIEQLTTFALQQGLLLPQQKGKGIISIK